MFIWLNTASSKSSARMFNEWAREDQIIIQIFSPLQNFRSDLRGPTSKIMLRPLFQKNNLVKLFMDEKNKFYCKTLLRNISKIYFKTLHKLLIIFQCQHSVPSEVSEINSHNHVVTNIPAPMHWKQEIRPKPQIIGYKKICSRKITSGLKHFTTPTSSF